MKLQDFVLLTVMERFVYFNSRDDFLRIGVSQIVYFMADKNYTILQMANGKKMIFAFSLSQMQKHLSTSLDEDAKIFARIGKSYIVNLNYIFQIEITKQRLVLCVQGNDDYRLSVSKEALKKLRSLYLNSK